MDLVENYNLKNCVASLAWYNKNLLNIHKSSINNQTIVTEEEFIIETVLKYFEAKREDVFSSSRLQGNVVPRYIIFALLKAYCGYTLAAIGKITGRDHTTVIYGLNIVSDKLLRDMTFKRFYEGITKDIDSVLNISENKKKSNLQSYRHIDVRN